MKKKIDENWNGMLVKNITDTLVIIILIQFTIFKTIIVSDMDINK